MSSEKMKKITINISQELYDKIEKNAKKDARSVSEYIRLLIEKKDGEEK